MSNKKQNVFLTLIETVYGGPAVKRLANNRISVELPEQGYFVVKLDDIQHVMISENDAEVNAQSLVSIALANDDFRDISCSREDAEKLVARIHKQLAKATWKSRGWKIAAVLAVIYLITMPVVPSSQALSPDQAKVVNQFEVKPNLFGK